MTSFVQHSIAEKFGIDVPASLTIGGHEKPSPFTPATDSDYNFRVDLLRDILAWWRMKGVLNEGLLLTGPTGSGKTSVIDQVCARLNMPVQRTSSNPRLEMTDLLGSFQLIDGETIWIDGPLTTAYREGHLFLLDEMDILDPGMLKSLNGVVEGQPLTLPNGGEVVIQHPDFRFVGTANSNGSGDDTGLYTGALRQDLSFLDRFVVLEVSYQSPSEELVLLQKKGPAILKDYFERMIAVANDVRDRFIGNNGFDDATAIEVTMSTRTLIRWAHYTSAFQSRLMDGDNPFTYAMTRALGNRAKPETKAYLEELVQRHLPKRANAVIKLKQVAPTGDTHVWFGRQEHAPDRIEVFVGLEDGPLKLQRFPKAVWVHSNGTEELDRMKTIACEHGYEETEETSLPKNKVNPSDIEPSAPDFLSVVVNAWF